MTNSVSDLAHTGHRDTAAVGDGQMPNCPSTGMHVLHVDMYRDSAPRSMSFISLVEKK